MLLLTFRLYHVPPCCSSLFLRTSSLRCLIFFPFSVFDLLELSSTSCRPELGQNGSVLRFFKICLSESPRFTAKNFPSPYPWSKMKLGPSRSCSTLLKEDSSCNEESFRVRSMKVILLFSASLHLPGRAFNVIRLPSIGAVTHLSTVWTAPVSIRFSAHRFAPWPGF